MFISKNRLFNILLMTFACFQINPSCQLEGTFSLPVDISAPVSDISLPQLAVNEAGQAVAIWQYYDGTDYTIQAAVLLSVEARWSAPFTISEKGKEASVPSVAIGSNGYATAVWASYDSETLTVKAATYLPELGWSVPATISSAGTQIAQTGVAIDSMGTTTAIWEFTDGAATTIQTAVLPYEGSWTAPATISTPGNMAAAPILRVSANGFLAAAWQELRGENHVVVASSSQFGRVWKEPVVVSAQETICSEIAIAVDDRHQIAVVWKQGGTLAINASFFSSTGVWSDPVSLSSPDSGGCSPQAAFYRDGKALIVWTSIAEEQQVVQASIWQEGDFPTLPVAVSAPGWVYDPQVAIDANDSAIVSWSLYNGNNSTVQSAVKPVNGDWLVPNNVSIPGDDAMGAATGADAQGNAILVWRKNIDDESYTIQAKQNLKVFPTIPEAPANFFGRTVKGRFGHSNDCVHRLEWQPSADPTIIGYKLFRNNQLIATIPAEGPFNFDDFFRNGRVRDIYRLAAVNAAGLESNSLFVVLK